MKTKNFLCKTISLLLCLCMTLQFFTNLPIGASETQAYYLQDIKIIYAESASEAKRKLPEGYALYGQNINDGTDELGVYLCYSVTTDESKAITDIRVMNENSGFNRGDFNEQMDVALSNLGQQAKAIHSAIINEFIPNLNQGLPGAKYAYDQLNIFMFDDNTRLGDYIKEGRITESDIAKMLLVCHNVILSAVLSLIAQGLQRPEGEDWLDKLEKMDPDDYEMNAKLQTKYAELISLFQEPMSSFSDAYNIMVYTDDVRDSMTVDQVAYYSEDLANEDTVKWWYTLWEILDSHKLAGGSGLTAEHVFVELNLGEGVAAHKICMLIDSLTEGQRALMQLVGPINFILSDVFTEETRVQAENDLAELKRENGTVSVWGGINSDIFESEVGITGAAYDEMATAGNYDIFTQENDTLEKSVKDYVSLVSNYAGIISGGITILSGLLVFVKGYTGTVVAIRALAHIGTFITTGLVGSIFTYGTIIITVVCILVTLIIWIIEEIQAGKPPAHDRTTIPKYMIDSIVDKDGAQIYEIYARVDNVQSDSELKRDSDMELEDVENMSGSDINANKGYHWAALYVSYSETVGNPIKAEFEISKDMDVAPDGFIGLRHFNRKSEAVDLNGVDEYNAEDPNLYLYYRGEKLPAEHRVYKYIRQIQAVEVSLRDPEDPDEYRFSASEAMEVARRELEGASPEYYVIDHNFSSDPDVVTMIGWNGTNDASAAIKDIRLVHNSTVGRAGAGLFGNITYANMGEIDDFSLFVSRMKNTDIPPVTRLKVVKKDEDPTATKGININMNEKESSLDSSGVENYGIGWEPVNEFTGGSAIPLGDAGAQLYFMPETTFTDGPDYLAGIEMDAYITNFGYPNPSETSDYLCSHVDIWDNDYKKYRAYKENTLGEHFYESSVLTVSNTDSNRPEEVHDKSNCPYRSQTTYRLLSPTTTSAVKYNLTKNPYRAIYGVSVRSGIDDTLRNSFTNFDGIGYALCPVEATISVAYIEFEEFRYTDLIKSDKSFLNKTILLEDRPYHSEKIVVNKDITQVSWDDFFEDIIVPMNNMYVMGYTAGREPLKPEDVIFSERRLSEGQYPHNFIPIPHMGGDGRDIESVSPFVVAIPVTIWEGTGPVRSMFKNLYGYVRSEIGVGDNKTIYRPGEGKYISNIYLASKEKIRTSSMLSSNPDAECSDVSYAHLEDQMINSGATNTFTVNIGTDYYSDGDDDANTVYVGISRTNDATEAIRDIRFYVCGPGETPKRIIKTSAVIPGQTLEYELVDGVSLTSEADLDCEKVLNNKGMEVWEETELLEDCQVYLYVCRNRTAFPNAITEIQFTDWCTPGIYTPVLSFWEETIYTAQSRESADLYISSDWLDEGKTIAFKREGNNDKYISKLSVEYGDDENQVKSRLVEAGYSVVNKDMNQSAAGPHIYIGCKYTDNERNAITNLLTLHDDDYSVSYSVTGEDHYYTMVSNVDLNKGAGGDYIYLYYTKDSRAGKPLIDLYGTSGATDYTDSRYEHATVRRLWDFEHSNLNAGTTFLTADIYLVMKREASKDTPKYISEIMVAYAWSRSGAIEKLAEAGFTDYVDKDLNAGTVSVLYIYIGYKRTNDPDKAIRDLQVLSKAETGLVYLNGSGYRLTSDVDLNRLCTGFSADLYLYYTKNESAGDPITDLYCTETPVYTKKDERGLHQTVKSDGEYVDLNEGAGGDYIYLVMVSQEAPPPVYTLTVNGGESPRYMYKQGDIVTVYANDDAPYEEFMAWKAEGVRLDPSKATDRELTFVMPANHVTLTAELVPYYTLTVNDGKSERYKYKEGETVTVYANDDSEDATFRAWKAGGIQLDPAREMDREITFVMPGNNVDLTAIFDYYLEVERGRSERYKWSPGETVTVYADLNNLREKEEFKCWKVEGVELDPSKLTDTEITFVMPKNKVVLTAVFARYYTLTVNDGESERYKYEEGETVTVTGDRGKLIDGETHLWAGWKAKGIELNTEQFIREELTFTMPANDVVLTSVFGNNIYRLSVDGGSSYRYLYAEGETVTVTASVPEGYVFSHWVVGGHKLSDQRFSETATFTMPASDVYLTAKYFKKAVVEEETNTEKLYTLRITGGTSDRYEYAEGETVTVTATIPEGKRFAYWVTGGHMTDPYQKNSATYTFTMPAGNVAFMAYFTEEGSTNSFAASMFGNGSWIFIAIAIMGLGVGITIPILRKKGIFKKK